MSGHTVEFEMSSLVPGSHYTVGVYGMKEAQKSASAFTEFVTGNSLVNMKQHVLCVSSVFRMLNLK